ncbi:uncharacterized protein LOC129311950 [Prosopis cineraria]|uniref:uncharacterized protein LOC129311950 n=1 Tax=Prosopis cineraria TaxID=364024 RepID=UPI0024106621|nr:uncharacterized protein LOC129311950 [Prosopis cineraria]XP_054810440.1 uncharacterized protein LOC129311950 [Prosopis cineraria]
MGPREPYWHTNTSFSPLPARWDFRFQSDGLPYDGFQLHGSSLYSEKDSRGSVRDNHLYDPHYSASDGTEPFLNSPSDFSQARQRTPPAIQEISIDDYETAVRKDLGRLFVTSTKEGTPENPDSWSSASSQSESCESDLFAKSQLSSQQNFSCHRSFISKPVHPLSFPDITAAREAFDPAVTGFSGIGVSTPLTDSQQCSSASSSLDFADAMVSFESEIPPRPHNDGFRCSLCERFLSQRSPWSSQRIVRSRDMPTTGVLPCRHVFHAECLEQTTPNLRKSDPPCPLCTQLAENSPDRGPLSMKNGFPRIRPFYEDRPSRPWGCAQAGGFVEAALHAPPRNTMFLLNRNRIKKNFSLKGNSSKEFPGKLRKSGPYSSQLFSGSSADQEAVGCSNAKAGPSMKQ